jgi:hypothetical protein
MSTKWLILLGAALAAAAGVAVAGTWCHCMWPRYAPGIPVRNYQYRWPSETVTALSLDPVADQEVDTEAASANIASYVYQWKDAELTIDHCSISGMTLKLFPDGRWKVSLRAVQNPDNVASIQTPDGRAKYIAHLKGNQFVISLRCFGNYKVRESGAFRTAGKPVLFTLRPPPFWVRKGEPQDYVYEGQHRQIANFFGQVDRVEVGFFYYRHSGWTLQ